MSAWQMEEGDCLPWLAAMGDRSVDHVITDPPYDAHVHTKSRRGASLPDTAEFRCRFNRAHEFGFDAITPEQIDACAREFARIARRWVLVFSNVELTHEWRTALTRHGLDYVRTGAWIKQRATPQFTGDRPGAGFEAITIAHPKGRKRWNGGGKQGVWTHPVVQNCNGHRGDRIHTAQKPLGLLLDLVRLFTDEGDTVADPFAGVATTGAAALRLGRNFVGCELSADYVRLARERLSVEATGVDYLAMRSGKTVRWSANDNSDKGAA